MAKKKKKKRGRESFDQVVSAPPQCSHTHTHRGAAQTRAHTHTHVYIQNVRIRVKNGRTVSWKRGSESVVVITSRFHILMAEVHAL